MKSMTGYGKATVQRDNVELTVELKSVNHRFLDITTKIPRSFLAYEDLIRKTIGEKIARGHVDVFVNFSVQSGRERKVTVDEGLAKGYLAAAAALAENFSLKNDFQVNALMRCGDVIGVEEVQEDEEQLRLMLAEGLASAADALNAMRLEEGERLHRDIAHRVDTIEKLVDEIKAYAPQVAEEYRKKLSARMAEILQGVEVDEGRLLNEVAFFSDKSNIDEEITRLYSHIANARNIFSLAEPVGRKLDFLIQEFNRESNTICSKSNNTTLTNLALDLKNEVEKVREQVQNLE